MLRNFYTQLERKTPNAVKRAIPEQWRVWLGYQIKVGRRGRATPPKSRQDNAAFLRPLALPSGETEQAIRDYLGGFYIEGEGLTPERQGYLHHAFRRFLYTLEIVPDGTGRLLEVGANPYFISLLLHRFTHYDLAYTNYLGPEGPPELEQIMVNDQGERLSFPAANYNLEDDPLPFADETFDIILLCEVLEHLTNDPYAALMHLKAGIKQGGHLVLTTPNVTRWQTVTQLVAGQNIFDDYSVYGPYGRHNREYTPDEVQRLLEHLGFVVEELFTSDVTLETANGLEPLMPLLARRRDRLGEYTFVRARNVGPANPKRPAWLYRSYPPDQIA